jgi:predicted nuclease of predicted toxin-antitoxin system
MRLLIDNQLPTQLARYLAGWGLDCIHVLDVGLERADDSEIWTAAITESRIVVSKDEDFLLLASRPGDQGRLIWVRLGNCRNAALQAAFDRARPSLLQAIAAGQRVFEIR